MVTISSCDHHDAYGLVPSSRSRATMLAQLRAATALGEALGAAFEEARVRQRAGMEPIVAFSLAAAVPLMNAWLAWLAISPSSPDDFAPPVEPPAEIRIPPLDADATETTP